MTGAARHPARRAGGPGRFPAWVRSGDLVVVSARMALDGGGRVAAPGDLAAQAELAVDALEEALREAGSSLGDVVDVMSFHLDPAGIDDVLRIAGPRLGDAPPAWTPMVATALAEPGALVAVSAIAHAGDGRRVCTTPDTIAWWRRLPVSAGCRKGSLVAVAGQYGSDADGNVNTPGDHAGQARNALNRVREICRLLDCEVDDVVGVLSAHQDPRGMLPAAAVYGDELFATTESALLPAWTAVGMPSLYGFGMLGQYRAIADVAGTGRMAGRPRDGEPPRHPTAAAAGKDGGSLVAVAAEATAPSGEALPADPAAQAHAALEALERSLAAVGADASDVVSVASFHKDIRDVPAFGDALRERGGDALPGWTPVGMTGSWSEDQLHAVHALAVRPRP